MNKECEWVLPRAGSSAYCRAQARAILVDEGWPALSFCEKHIGRWVINAAKRNSLGQIQVGMFGIIRVPKAGTSDV
jgi:hypothetical protein